MGLPGLSLAHTAATRYGAWCRCAPCRPPLLAGRDAVYVLSAPMAGCGPAGSLPTFDMPFIRDLILRVSAAEEDSDKPHPRWSEPVLILTCSGLHQSWGAFWVLQAGGHQVLLLHVAADVWSELHQL